jgi:serine/threonine protein kinase
VPKLLDFGIAKADGGGSETSTGGLVGTPSYMAPEQLVNGRLGPATDVWAMGAVLYRCLSGAAPLSGATPAQTLAKIATELAPPLEVEGLHRGFAAAIDRALHRGATHRYASMGDFCAALTRAADAAGIECPAPSLPSVAVDLSAAQDERTREVSATIPETTPLELSVDRAAPRRTAARAADPPRWRGLALAAGVCCAATLGAIFARPAPALTESTVLEGQPRRERVELSDRFVARIEMGSSLRRRNAAPSASSAVLPAAPTPGRSRPVDRAASRPIAVPIDERTSGLPVAVEW